MVLAEDTAARARSVLRAEKEKSENEKIKELQNLLNESNERERLLAHEKEVLLGDLQKKLFTEQVLEQCTTDPKKRSCETKLDECTESAVKKSKRIQESKRYVENQKVEAFYKPDSQWYAATILKVTRSGCEVCYDEDNFKEFVSFKYLRMQSAKISHQQE